ncbi:MAG: response regulator [Desulfobacterales bacterium]|jgi:FixJ family two-component response regulator
MSPDAECSIIDAQMPGLTGLEVQERMNGNGLDVPVIFIVAHDEEGIEKHALQGEAAGFLRKPISEESLVNLILSASLGRRKAGLNWGMDRNLVFVGPGMPRR